MDMEEVTKMIEGNTGAIFLDKVVPLSTEMQDALEMSEVDRFWSKFFAAKLVFGSTGQITSESLEDILSELEYVHEVSATLARHLLGIMPSHVSTPNPP